MAFVWVIGIWNLEFIWDLEFGIWNLKRAPAPCEDGQIISAKVGG